MFDEAYLPSYLDDALLLIQRNIYRATLEFDIDLELKMRVRV